MMLPAVALGIALAAVGGVSFDPHDGGIADLVQLALVLTLFSDGLVVERELLWLHWRPVTRSIVLAMPITLGLLGLGAWALFPGLDWLDAFLLAAVLTPTDPVVTSSIITSTRVPRDVRHLLNLESGLNDGLALPFVLLFLVLAAPSGDSGVAFGLTDLASDSSLIAAFLAGIALAATKRKVPGVFAAFAHRVSSIFQVVVFFVFGALVYATGFDGAIWRLALFIAFALLVARPLSIALSFLGEKLPHAQRAFIAWFGPKGVASMLFALFVLQSAVPQRELIFDVVAFTILASIAAHGLTDTVGARWLARRSG